MDDDEVDLNQDWFFEAADQPHPVKHVPSSPLQNGGPGRGNGEYTALNVPLEDEYPRMLQSTSQQVVYHQQQQRVYQQDRSNYMENSKYDESVQISSQQMQRQALQRPVHQQHERVLQQSENYNFPLGQQPPPNQQQFQMIKQQQQADWDMMQTRPNSQMQMRPDSQMQMRPDSQMHNHQQYTSHSQQQYFGDQQQFGDSRSGPNTQSFSNAPQMQSMQTPQNQVVYKQQQQVQYAASSSTSQFSSVDGNQFISGQQGGMYQAYPQQPMDREQRLSGGMEPMMSGPQGDNYNITPPAASKKPPPSKQRKAPPKQAPQVIIQQQTIPVQPQMQPQFAPLGQTMPELQQPTPAPPKKKKPSRKAPSMEDIQSRFARVSGLTFDTPQKSAEFMSILMQLQSNPNANAEERTALAERLDKLLGSAEISQQEAAATAAAALEQQSLQESRNSKSKSRKKPTGQTIEALPPGYISDQPVFPSQPPPQISTNSKTIILDYGNNVYTTTTGPSTSFAQIPIQQTQPISFNNPQPEQPVKKPARKRPPRKGAQQPPTVSIPVESLSNVVQTSSGQLGQQILICTQSGATTNPPVMISYENIYQPPGGGGQQIILQYQPVPAVPIQQPLSDTPKEIAAKIQTAQTNRQNKVSKFFDDLHRRLEDTDYISPFKSRADVIDRLLPFAFNYEPDYSDEYLEKVEHETLRRFVHLDDRIKHIKNRLHKICLTEAIGAHEYDYDLNMLLYLDAEYEQRRLKNDELEAKKDLDSFLRESEIIRAGVDLSEIELKKRQLVKPKELVDPHTSLYGTYEYNEFDENVFARVEVTPPPSPPKPIQKSKKKREKSRYMDSDMEDTSDEDDEDEVKTPKLNKPSSVTELIDLNAINTMDPEPDSMLLVRTPDADEIAANEQTEAIDKALDLLPHDLENVIPFVFTPEAATKDVQYDLPLNLQEQSSTNFVPQIPTSKLAPNQSPDFGMLPPTSMVNTSTSFATTNISSQLHTTTSQKQSPFDASFKVMKTPPSQSKVMDFQQQIQKLPTTTTANQFQMPKNVFVSNAQIAPLTLSSPKQSDQQLNKPKEVPQISNVPPISSTPSISTVPPISSMPSISTVLASISSTMPSMTQPSLPPHLAHKIQQPSPLNSMKSPPSLNKPGPSTISNNTTVDNIEKPPVPSLIPNIPKFNAINADKNPLLNPALSLSTTMPSILRPPTRFDAPLLQQTMTALSNLHQDNSLLQQTMAAMSSLQQQSIASMSGFQQNRPLLQQMSNLQQEKSFLQHMSNLQQLANLQQSMNSMSNLKQEKPRPKPLEPPAAFDDPLLLKSYQTPSGSQMSLKKRLLQARAPQTMPDPMTQAKLMEQLQAVKQRVESGNMSEPPVTEPNAPTIPSKQPELAAVSMNESARLRNSMMQKLQKKQEEKFTKLGVDSQPSNIEPIIITQNPIETPPMIQQKVPEIIHPTNKLLAPPPLLQFPKPANNKPAPKVGSSTGMEESDDESAQQKMSDQPKLGPPAPLDVTPVHSMSLSRPSPSSALPVRLRFKFSNNNNANGDSYAGYSNMNEFKRPTVTTTFNFPPTLPAPPSVTALKVPEVPKLEPVNVPTPKETILPPPATKTEVDEKELKRKRKEEKRLRKEQKKLRKKEKHEKKMAEESQQEKEPLKLRIRIGPKDEDQPQSDLKPSSKLTPLPVQTKEPKLSIKLSPKEEPKSDEKVPKIKIRIGPKEPKESKPKKAKKRRRSPTNEVPPKIEQQPTEPKLPRLKIKIGKDNTPDDDPPAKSVTEKPDSSGQGLQKSIPPTQRSNSQTTLRIKPISKPPPLTTTPMASKLSTSSVPDMSPVPNSAQSMPLLTPTSAMPDFSDEEQDDSKNDQLKKLSCKLVTSLTKP